MTAQLTSWIADLGLAGVFALMAVDALLPAGGELIMLFAGALAAGAISGHPASSLAAAVAAGTLGYLAGSLAGWALGRAGGRPFIARHGRWLHLGPERFRRAERWFGRYGSAFVLFGRLTPLVRSFVSVPAGALEYPLAPYAALTAVASLLWCAAFGIAGYALGVHWDSVHHAFRYADYAAVALLAAGAVTLLIRRRGARVISYFQAVVLGLIQGAAELFPVSSLGHSVIAPKLLGWDIQQNDDAFLTFLVATHLATALVLLGFFRRDWARIVRGLLRSVRRRGIAPGDTDARLGWYLILGTIPAGLLGLLLEHSLRRVFASPTSAAIFLFCNGLMLFGAERLRRGAPGPPRRAPERRARRARADPAQGDRDRHRPDDRAPAGLLALGRHDGGRAARGPLERGRRALLVPARHADHRRGRRAQAPGPPRAAGRRAARPRFGGCAVRRGGRLRLGALPRALLRDQPADAVRDLLLRRGRDLHHRVRRWLTVAPGSFDPGARRGDL